MRDPERIDRILGKLAAYWKTYPDLRLGQIIVNAIAMSEIKKEHLFPGSSNTIFSTEDDKMEESLDALVEHSKDWINQSIPKRRKNKIAG